jgi:hypothetical protein
MYVYAMMCTKCACTYFCKICCECAIVNCCMRWETWNQTRHGLHGIMTKYILSYTMHKQFLPHIQSSCIIKFLRMFIHHESTRSYTYSIIMHKHTHLLTHVHTLCIGTFLHKFIHHEWTRSCTRSYTMHKHILIHVHTPWIDSFLHTFVYYACILTRRNKYIHIHRHEAHMSPCRYMHACRSTCIRVACTCIHTCLHTHRSVRPSGLHINNPHVWSCMYTHMLTDM